MLNKVNTLAEFATARTNFNPYLSATVSPDRPNKLAALNSLISCYQRHAFGTRRRADYSVCRVSRVVFGELRGQGHHLRRQRVDAYASRINHGLNCIFNGSSCS
jgi:hypothetical protein